MKRPALSFAGAALDLSFLAAIIAGVWLLWNVFDWFIVCYLKGVC